MTDKVYTKINFDRLNSIGEKQEFFNTIPTSENNYFESEIWRLANQIINENLHRELDKTLEINKYLKEFKKIIEIALSDRKTGNRYLQDYVLNDLKL